MATVRTTQTLEIEARYRESHRLQLNQRRRDYYKNNKEKCLAYSRRYWAEHPELRLKHYTARQQRLMDKPETRVRRNEVARKGMLKLRREVLQQYGSICQCCSESRNEFLAIDHMNGCSRELRQLQGGGSTFYRWLKRNGFPPGYQVLCHNCNMAKGFHGYCPHQKDKVN